MGSASGRRHRREWAAAATITLDREIKFPHSLGLLYSAFTYYTGFKVNSGEYKVMGLAPYGRPRFTQTILDKLIDVKEDGTFRLDLSYFDYCTGLRMTNDSFSTLFGLPVRGPDQLLTQDHMDLAASIQDGDRDRHAAHGQKPRHGIRHEKPVPRRRRGAQLRGQRQDSEDGDFDNIWIQPAAGDAGGALGAALAAWHGQLGKPRETPARPDAMQGAYLGPSFTRAKSRPRSSSPGHASPAFRG